VRLAGSRAHGVKCTLASVTFACHILSVDEADCVYGVEDLAERGGVSRRTVRYYIQRGLLPPPHGLGRGKHYTEAHLATLVRIKELQEQAVPLEAIADQLHAPLARVTAPSAPPEPLQSSWTRIAITPDLELHVRGRRLSEEHMHELVLAVKKVMGGMSR
jgi:DNA-binding transcriptional MerR regulator